MKFDLHCHTKEGSIDAKVNLEAYIHKLIQDGFDGMLVTDHNSYKGYEACRNLLNNLTLPRPFTVLKGIEYDTLDGGHIIAVLPEHIHTSLLEKRGLTIAQLEAVVHHLGGILGPAHPYGTGFFAIMNTRFLKKHKDFLKNFDFIETFNSYNHPLANYKAELLAKKYQLPKTAGSDAHHPHVVGTAATFIGESIHNNDDLIRAIREHKNTFVDAAQQTSVYTKTSFLLEKAGIIGYWIYNRLGAFLYAHARKKELKKLRTD